MAYPAPFHRLVMIGDLYSDIFNVTLSIIPGTGGPLPAVTQLLADAVATNVKAWWPKMVLGTTGGGLGISQAAQLTSIKLNRIGTDGRYMDPDAIESTFTPVAGGSTVLPPAQLSLAATLRGTAPRALAGKGRMYFPPSVICTDVTSDGRVSATNATNYARGVRELILTVKQAYDYYNLGSAVGIASETRGGAFQVVDYITVGRTIDTIRSRRNKVPEDFVTLDI